MSLPRRLFLYDTSVNGMFHKFIRHVPSPKNNCRISEAGMEDVFMIGMSENIKFQNTADSDILIAKSGISNHAAAGICDDPCLSKFGALYGLCPQAGRQF